MGLCLLVALIVAVAIISVDSLIALFDPNAYLVHQLLAHKH